MNKSALTQQYAAARKNHPLRPTYDEICWGLPPDTAWKSIDFMDHKDMDTHYSSCHYMLIGQAMMMLDWELRVMGNKRVLSDTMKQDGVERTGAAFVLVKSIPETGYYMQKVVAKPAESEEEAIKRRVSSYYKPFELKYIQDTDLMLLDMHEHPGICAGDKVYKAQVRREMGLMALEQETDEDTYFITQTAALGHLLLHPAELAILMKSGKLKVLSQSTAAKQICNAYSYEQARFWGYSVDQIKKDRNSDSGLAELNKKGCRNLDANEGFIRVFDNVPQSLEDFGLVQVSSYVHGAIGMKYAIEMFANQWCYSYKIVGREVHQLFLGTNLTIFPMKDDGRIAMGYSMRGNCRMPQAAMGINESFQVWLSETPTPVVFTGTHWQQYWNTCFKQFPERQIAGFSPSPVQYNPHLAQLIAEKQADAHR